MAMEVMADTEPPTAWGADATTLMVPQCPAEAKGQLRLSLRLTMVALDMDMELTSHPLASKSSPWSLPGTELLSLARPQLLRLLRLITLLPSSASVRLTLRLMPTTATEDMVDTVSAMEATAMAVLATAMARGLPTPRLMPTTAMEAMVDTVLVTPLATVLDTDTAVMERGPLILRPMPTTVMADMVDMDSDTVDTAMAILATAMARGLLRPSLTMDMVELTPDMGMVDTDLVLAMATASKH